MKHRSLELAGLTGNIAALERGSIDGIPVVAIHGWLDNAASFLPLSELLDHYRWICLDLPGHGLSDYRPPGCVYHYTDYIADLRCAMDSLGFDRCHLVGHSLGAGIAATFAAAFPAMVDRLVLIDGIGPIAADDTGSLQQLRKAMAFYERPADTGPRVYPSWEGLVERRLEAGDIQRRSVEMLLERGTIRDRDSVTVLSDGRLKQHSPIYMSQTKVLSILGGIEAPTLFVMATDGLLKSRESTEARQRAIKDLRVLEVEGAHHVHMDEPDLLAGAMDKFLSSGN